MKAFVLIAAAAFTGFAFTGPGLAQSSDAAQPQAPNEAAGVAPPMQLPGPAAAASTLESTPAPVDPSSPAAAAPAPAAASTPTPTDAKPADAASTNPATAAPTNPAPTAANPSGDTEAIRKAQQNGAYPLKSGGTYQAPASRPAPRWNETYGRT